MLCPLFFLLKISEGKIGIANPQFFASVIRLDLAGLYNSAKVRVAYTEYTILDRNVLGGIFT
jgi:hypothetical protein